MCIWGVGTLMRSVLPRHARPDHPFTRTVGGAYVRGDAGRAGRAVSPQYRAGTVSKRRPYRRTFGTPTSLVLYRTPDGWRYAVHLTGPAGIADGSLAGPPPSSEPHIAQAALVRKAGELPHRRLDVLRHVPDQPDWWTGTVTVAGPLTPAWSRRIDAVRAPDPDGVGHHTQQQPPVPVLLSKPVNISIPARVAAASQTGVHPLPALAGGSHCLLSVACTRARDGLYVSWSGTPSPFFTEAGLTG